VRNTPAAPYFASLCAAFQQIACAAATCRLHQSACKAISYTLIPITYTDTDTPDCISGYRELGFHRLGNPSGCVSACFKRGVTVLEQRPHARGCVQTSHSTHNAPTDCAVRWRRPVKEHATPATGSDALRELFCSPPSPYISRVSAHTTHAARQIAGQRSAACHTGWARRQETASDAVSDSARATSGANRSLMNTSFSRMKPPRPRATASAAHILTSDMCSSLP